MVEILIKESGNILEKVKKEYLQATVNIFEQNSRMRDLTRLLRDMSDSNSEEYASWASALRAGAYSAAGSVTVGMIIADVLGCLGVCSIVGNSVGWGTAVATTETSIAL